MQGAKEQVERASEAETIEGLANHIGNLIENDPELMVVWGSGGTLRRMGEHLGLELTLLGIDIQHKGTVYQISMNPPCSTILQPMKALVCFFSRRWEVKVSSSVEATSNSHPKS